MGLLDQWAGKKLESYKPTGDGLLNVTKNAVASLFDPESPLSKKAAAWHKKLQKGIQHSLEGKDTPYAEFAYQEGLNMAGLGAMTAWHGSPHKFDKFSLDKIGTGEGAQAYGHGLYLAQNPNVAGYYTKLDYNNLAAVEHPQGGYSLLDGKRDEFVTPPFRTKQEALDFKEQVAQGYAYKTDIPDEAVARFLDWDKPLSQQAPEVQAALINSGAWKPRVKEPLYDIVQKSDGQWYGVSKKFGDTTKDGFPAKENADAYLNNLDLTTLKDILPYGGDNVQLQFSNKLRSSGIPGIRYLDGGSRSAGQGSSNFVIFDPDMIRILERNGQSTGLLPWSPGEYGLLK